MNDYLYVYDEYDQRWRMEYGDPLYLEAQAAIKETDGSRVHWPLSKITEGRGFGWWTVFKSLDELEAKLTKVMLNPDQQPLLDDRDKSPSELSELIQRYGGYISYLQGIAGRLRAEALALRESYKTGMAVSTAAIKTGSEKAKEAQVLESNELFRQTKRLEIQTEAALEMVEGWIKAYDIAWQSVSRTVTLHMGDVSLQTGRRV